MQTQREDLLHKPFSKQNIYLVDHQSRSQGFTKTENEIFKETTDHAIEVISDEIKRSSNTSHPTTTTTATAIEINAVTTRLKGKIDDAALERASQLLAAQRSDPKISALTDKVKKFEERMKTIYSVLLWRQE